MKPFEFEDVILNILFFATLKFEYEPLLQSAL